MSVMIYVLFAGFTARGKAPSIASLEHTQEVYLRLTYTHHDLSNDIIITQAHTGYIVKHKRFTKRNTILYTCMSTSN